MNRFLNHFLFVFVSQETNDFELLFYVFQFDVLRMYCKICQIEFSTKQTFKRHVLDIHERSVFMCKLCAATFHSKHANRMHRITHHECNFKCEKCERTFKEKKTLNRHVRQNHTNLQNMITKTSLSTNHFALRSQGKAGKSL